MSWGWKHGLKAVILGRMGHWDSAGDEMKRSIARWTERKSRAYSPLDMEVLTRYFDVLRREDRIEEILEAISNKRLRDRIRRPANLELIELVYRVLADLPNPTQAVNDFLQFRSAGKGENGR